MARSFNGTSDYLRSAATLSGLDAASRLSISFWYYGVLAADDDMILEYGANAFTGSPGLFAVVGNSSDGTGTWIYMSGTTHSHSAHLATSPSNNTWHHWLINYDMTLAGGNLEVVSVYIDGTLQTFTGTDGSDFSNTGATFANETLNVMCRNGSTLFQDGRLADLCIWTPSSVLSSTDASTLAGGARANSVRSSEVAYYWPLLGTSSPEPATVGGTALTVSGATYVADPPLLSALSPLTFSVTKTDSTHTSVSWTASDSSITNGVSIVRAAGDKTTSTDGNGVAVGGAGYDPTTIAGATTIASAVTTSPYADTVPTSGTYTYWINRTA